LWEVL
jgi:hypothetical protein